MTLAVPPFAISAENPDWQLLGKIGIGVVVVLEWYYRVIRPAHVPLDLLSSADFFTQIYPMWVRTAELWRDGVLPLWNPYISGGRPYLANAQSAIFSPFSWPAYILPFWWSLGFIAALKLFLGAFGTYLLGRVLADLSTGWFALPDGDFMRPDYRPHESPADGSPRALCPESFLATARYIFSPHPTASSSTRGSGWEPRGESEGSPSTSSRMGSATESSCSRRVSTTPRRRCYFTPSTGAWPG